MRPSVKKFTPPTDNPAGDQLPAQTPIAPTETKAVVETRSRGKKTAAQTIAELELKVTRQRRTMNIVKSIMPIVRSIIVNPGAYATSAEKANAINSMTSMATDASALMMVEIAPDLMEKGWANAEAFGVCTDIIANEWQQNGSLDGARDLLNPEFVKLVASGMADVDAKSLKWLENSGNVPPIKNETDAATRIRISLLKAASPLIADIRAFSFWKQHLGSEETQKFTAGLVDQLANIAAENANRQADSYGMDADHRIMLWQGTIARAFEFAREEYRVLAQKALNEVDAALDGKAKGAVRRDWATDNKEDVTLQVVKIADNAIRLLDGIVTRAISDAFDADAKPQKGMKP